MNPWPFVIAAYAVTVIVTLGLVGWAWRAMRIAERAAGELGGK